jgi:hypothetical protein
MPSDYEEMLRELVDREAIRDVYARYARGVDRADAALLSSAYHAEAVEDHHGETYKGDTIGEALTAMVLRSMSRTSTHFTTLSISVKGDKAGCEAHYINIHVLKAKGEEKRLITSGRTLDRLERRSGDWRFIHRVIVPDMMRVMSMDAMQLGRAISKRGPDDPSYDVLSALD